MDTIRQAPYSCEAEQAVIGGIMLAPESFERVGEFLDEEHFYRRDHRLIYRAIAELRGREKPSPIDPVTLGEWFEANGLAEQIGGSSYLIDLASSTPSAANVIAYAEIVREKATQRDLIEQGTWLVNQGFRPEGASTADIVAEHHLRMAKFQAPAGSGSPQLVKTTLKSWFEGFAKRYEIGHKVTGLPTPWHDVNEITNGLQDGDLVILAGRPSMGKSILGHELATFTALRGDNVAEFSLEMTAAALQGRSISALGSVPHSFIRAPNPADEQDGWMSRISGAVRHLNTAKLHIDDTPGLTAAQIVARARRLHLSHPLRLVVIDHLHIVAIKGRDPNTEIGQATKLFKGLAKFLGCPVVVLSQLNRKLEDRNDKVPSLADLRASGDIEQDADLVMFVHRPDYFRKAHEQKTHDVQIIFAKGRDIEISKDPTILREEFKYMRAVDWVGERPAIVDEATTREKVTRERWTPAVGSRALKKGEQKDAFPD